MAKEAAAEGCRAGRIGGRKEVEMEMEMDCVLPWLFLKGGRDEAEPSLCVSVSVSVTVYALFHFS